MSSGELTHVSSGELTHEGYFVTFLPKNFTLPDIFYVDAKKSQEEARGVISQMLDVSVDLIKLERII